MVDYVKLSATVLRLITKNGRTIQLIRKDQTSDDPTKPWDGPPGSSDNLTPISAIFVTPKMTKQFGLFPLGSNVKFEDLMARSEQIAIVNPEALELRDFIKIRETDGTEWGIIGIQVLKPGEIQLLAFIGVSR